MDESGIQRAKKLQEKMFELLGNYDMKFLKDNGIELVEYLAKGGYGAVFRGVQNGSREVAVKLQNLDEYTASNFVTELAVFATLKHPHLMQIYDVFRCGEKVIYTLELFRGRDLFEVVFSEEPVSESTICRLYTQFASGVNFMHSNGYAHRDLKPNNIMVDETWTLCKIGDFGLVARAYDLKTGNPNVYQFGGMGTVMYMAPEILTGYHNRRCVYEHSLLEADIWSLGVALYQLLQGFVYPFGGKSTRSKVGSDYYYDLVQNNPIVYNRIISRDSKRFIERHLIQDPKKRPTLDELLADPWIKMQFRSPIRLPKGPPQQND